MDLMPTKIYSEVISNLVLGQQSVTLQKQDKLKEIHIYFILFVYNMAGNHIKH